MKIFRIPILALAIATTADAVSVAPLPSAVSPVAQVSNAPEGPATVSQWWQRVFRPTNSHAAADRGARQFEKKKFAEAERSFDIADHLAPDTQSAFNLGTAQIAAGRSSEGAVTLGRALRNTLLRPDAYYNRGNGALASKAWEYAIRDYKEALKLRPSDMAAKRNLEIALRRLDEMQRSSSSGGSNRQQSQQQSKNQQKAPSAGSQQQQQQQQGDVEALLRSVQQQEQEELERMKKARAANVRIGW